MKIKIFNNKEYVIKFTNTYHNHIKNKFIENIYSDKNISQENRKIDDNTTICLDNLSRVIGSDIKSNIYESDFFYFDRIQKEDFFEKFFMFLNLCLDNVVDYLTDDYGIIFNQFRQSINFKFESWYHISNNLGYHDFHDHFSGPGTPLICGIYVLQSFNNNGTNGQLEFLSSDIFSTFKKNFTDLILRKENECDYELFKPKINEGDLFLFTPTLCHRALSYNHEKDRIVIAFNAFMEKHD